MERVIKLNNDYGISADDMNVVLHKVRVVKEGKNAGNVQYSAIGYYSNVEGLLKGLINKQIQLNIKEQQSLEAVADSVEKYISLLHDDVCVIVRDLRK